MSDIPDHEHDENGDCILPAEYVQQPPNYALNPYGLLYNVTVLFGNIAGAVGNFFAMVSTDLAAANNDLQQRRQIAAWEAHQREEAEQLARMTSYVREREEDTP